MKSESCHYRPQRGCEGYVFTGVCLSGGGGGIRACLAGGIPECLAAGLGGVSQHALQVVSEHVLQQVSEGGGIPACLAAGLQGGPAPGGPARGVPAPGGYLLLGAGAVWGDPPPPGQQTATVADGTHSTGMHSCFMKANQIYLMVQSRA